MASTKKVSNNIIAAILYILLGVLFIVFKSGMLNWLMTIVGIVFIALGVYDIIQRRLANGIIEAAIGVVVILGGWLFVEIVLIVLGALLVVKGASDLIALCKGSKDVMGIIVAALTIILGILLIVSKWAMLDWMFIVIGVVFIVEGAFTLFPSLKK